MYTYEENVIPYRGSYKMMLITQEEEKRIAAFAQAVIEEKKHEDHHKRDAGQRIKRFTTGMMGEVAVEKFIRTPFVDWNIGHSSEFNVSDLNSIGLNVGIKTVETGKFPIIHKQSKRAEIIVIRGTRNRMIICGLATPNVLNTHQSDDLILSPALRKRNVKTGFYGFHHLLPFHSLDELRSLL